ncbi:MAG: DUF2948 family protein [Pseudotabrizicola sp.]|uniref:DUF2948 family protein n=1 Tax=Pseudotabrizicola sp. TaxID=2939647 RepID=UPI00271D139B|nr:DUF2948 family protein [Pseudotabrizicola sp.]MDO9640365.1 DUF2948 family protein [Pseudotabrizicola sp.]
MTDARYEDGDEAPLRLIAAEAADLPVMAALLQDAVFPITEMRFDAKARRFALLLNRFRWEDRAAAEAANRPYERVRSLLVVEDVLRLRSSGIDRSDTQTVLSLLTLDFAPGVDGMGTLTLTLAGDGAIAIEVEAVNLRLDDVTRPYIAPSRQMPDHG